jgi:hypothetical protein
MKKLIVILASIYSVFTTNLMAQVPNYVPTNGLVAWYPFNGNAIDSSGNNNNGSINGGTYISDRNGLLNSALSLPNLGNNSMVGNVAPQFNNFGLSLSVWLRFPNQYNQSSLAVIKNGIPYSNGFNVAIDQNNQAYGVNNYLVVFLVGNGTAVTFISNQSELGQWSHLVSTYDSNSIKIYLNGILKATQPFNLSLNCPNNDLIFGQWDNPTAPSVTNRNIDDIGIWNRALTQQEITDLYNSCGKNLAISPTNNYKMIGTNATFTAMVSDTNPSYIWQSNFGQGFQTLNNVGNYSGTSTNTMSVSNVQLSNHMVPIRAISTSGSCKDTSNIAYIQITDTCITKINDTIKVTKHDTIKVTKYDTITTKITKYDTIKVMDTLVINANLSGISAPNNTNRIIVYPNPAKDHITIDYGVFSRMSGYTVKITNTLGQTVFISLINQQTSYINLSTWTGKGLYYLQIIDPNSNMIENRKIVLQ